MSGGCSVRASLHRLSHQHRAPLASADQTRLHEHGSQRTRLLYLPSSQQISCLPPCLSLSLLVSFCPPIPSASLLSFGLSICFIRPHCTHCVSECVFLFSAPQRVLLPAAWVGGLEKRARVGVVGGGDRFLHYCQGVTSINTASSYLSLPLPRPSLQLVNKTHTYKKNTAQ